MSKILIIAEVGVNHNGSMQLAKELIDVSKRCGANIVKFQSFFPEFLATTTSQKASYQMKNTSSDETHFKMLKNLSLSFDEQLELKDYCKKNNIEFLSTAFDKKSLRFLVQKLQIKRIKVPSGEINNYPLLAEIGTKKLPVILSTGMSRIPEIEKAISIISFFYDNPKTKFSHKRLLDIFATNYISNDFLKVLTLLQCSTEYPTPPKNINLRSMLTLNRIFGTHFGLSDHSMGLGASICAAYEGASVIEKHITLDKGLEGPDHVASLEPREFENFVNEVRKAGKYKGLASKIPSEAELKNANVARRKIIAAKNINKGKLILDSDIKLLRSKSGLSASNYLQVVGTISKKDFLKDDPII